MNSPSYPVNIYYQPPQTTGVQSAVIGGVTYSVPTQTGNYYVATMALANISATGSDYRTALNNLLILATASTTADPLVMPFKPTW